MQKVRSCIISELQNVFGQNDNFYNYTVFLLKKTFIFQTTFPKIKNCLVIWTKKEWKLSQISNNTKLARLLQVYMVSKIS